MKAISILICLGLVSMLCACISSPEKVHLYSLALSADTEHMQGTEPAGANRCRVVVGSIELPRFLRQRGLALQVGETRVVSARHNLWAEPLEEAVSQLLVQRLNRKSEKFRFENTAGQWNQGATWHLRLEFEQFHATDAANVVVSGRYWLYGKNHAPIVDNIFNYSKPLTEDGYTHVVITLRQTIDRLSSGILVTLHGLDLERPSDCSG